MTDETIEKDTGVDDDDFEKDFEGKPDEDYISERDPLGYLILPIFAVILIAVVLLWLYQKPEEKKTVYFPVTGKVKFEGKALEGYFQITFFPEKENATSEDGIASAILEEDGSYTLYTGKEGQKGAMSGKYKVCVKMLEGPNVSFRASADAVIRVDPNDGGTIAPDDPDPPFPKNYSIRKKTPQRAIVVEGENIIDIDL